MDTFIARQPIFDSDKRVYGYELLFRSSLDNFFKHPDPDQATSKVIADSFFLMGMSTLTGGKRAFINITRDILIQDYLFLIPKELIVVEILETVEPDAQVVEACKKLKRAGYLLAFDDFIYQEVYSPLMEVIDFIKVDFLSMGESQQKSLVHQFSSSKVRFLAEKVETPEVFRGAMEMGYQYFQGYFFSKPAIISGKDIPGYKLHYLQILSEIHRPELDFKQLDLIIKQEMSLSFKLLRYINSAFFGLRCKVNSIKQVLLLIGEKEIRKWVSLITLAHMGGDKPEELIIQAIIRAKFCESLGSFSGLSLRAEDLFLMGMFSLIDAILDRSLSDILSEIPIANDVKEALMGEKNRLRNILEYVLLYEKGEWDHLSLQASKLGMDEAIPLRLYLDAIKWGHCCFQEGSLNH
jgi:c-di-GMP-related signal transduction protein